MAVAKDAGEPLARATVRPDVPMQMYTCLPQVLALGLAKSLGQRGVDDVRVSWPASVSVGGEPALRVDVRAGYDEGMYAACEVAALEGAAGLPELADEAMLAAALEDAAGAWETSLRAAHVVAGPLAPLLEEYFDLLDCANREVEVVYPNGRVATRGVLAGMDVWGRAAVRCASGRELNISPEQASIRPARG
ncbi:MAG: hypothetical protein ACI38Z_08870 [Parafannyhessea sp.]|uniref:hypothetical protein n=1 Tax=Parafannyhessea sp. TaxID=2847324 RepID=UPI003F0D08FD